MTLSATPSTYRFDASPRRKPCPRRHSISAFFGQNVAPYDVRQNASGEDELVMCFLTVPFQCLSDDRGRGNPEALGAWELRYSSRSNSLIR
jgi:hypothetical protein